MTTVFCIRVETTIPSRAWPRTERRPWNGHFGSLQAAAGSGTSIPMSRAAGPAAGEASFFDALFSAIVPHRALFTRSSGRKRISSPSTSRPPWTSNRNRLPCFGIRFSRPSTSRTRVFRVSSTTRPRTRAWLGSIASRTSTWRPISSCFRRFISFLRRRSAGRWGRGGRLGLAQRPFLGGDRQEPRDVLPQGADLARIRRGAAHRGHPALVHQLLPELGQLLLPGVGVHRPDLLRPQEGHYVSSPPVGSTSASTPRSFTSFATFLSRFAATRLFLTFGTSAVGSSSGSGSSSASSPATTATAFAAVSGGASGGSTASAASAAAALAAKYSAEGILISTSSGSLAFGSMISTVTPMIPGFSFAAAKPRSIHWFLGSPQYLM